MKRSSVHITILFLMIIIIPAIFGFGLIWGSIITGPLTEKVVVVQALVKNLSFTLAGLVLLFRPQALVDVVLRLFHMQPESLPRATQWLRVVGLVLLAGSVFSGQLELRELIAALQH